MKEFVVTKDGSHTIAIPEQKVTYHSLRGAVAESKHVFIEAGLNYLLSKKPDEEVEIFEMGFGTGLNAFLTAIAATETKRRIHYTAVETTPLSLEEMTPLNYRGNLGYEKSFTKHMAVTGKKKSASTNSFPFEKSISHFSIITNQVFDLVYYDAFAPSAQPEFWKKEAFEKLQHAIANRCSHYFLLKR